MATVSPTITYLGGDEQVIKAVWALTTANSDGAPLHSKFAEYADRTVYVLNGTWGGATLVWQGGDGAYWQTLTDAQTVAISKTADFMETVVETPEFSRPNLSAVGVGAVLTVTCIARRGYKRN